jgi:hypothetical protein
MGSIPNEIVGIFPRLNRSGSTMALQSIQHLTAMSASDIFCGVKQGGA